ncbi:sigma factor [Streptomyces sp. NPDC056224]|uniref:sigma factor n=1 Tax=Streptomyces sp. NPDC056224 TaxID=3345750 RepID=UPI0035DDC8F4
MTGQDVPAQRFEAQRARLRAVAYRMLGSPAETEDGAQEVWLKPSRSDADAVDNLGVLKGRPRGRAGTCPLSERAAGRSRPPRRVACGPGRPCP